MSELIWHKPRISAEQHTRGKNQNPCVLRFTGIDWSCEAPGMAQNTSRMSLEECTKPRLDHLRTRDILSNGGEQS
jgi:adenylylsulfate kinase-like enzyme